MRKKSPLSQEVDEIIRSRSETDEPIAAAWVVSAVLTRHPNIQGSDAGWYRLCAYEHVRDVVRRAFRGFKPNRKGDTDKQLLLPGFESLQKRYMISRQGQQMAVRIEQLTDEENAAKVSELRGMAGGCLKHADELERYHAGLKRAAERTV